MVGGVLFVINLCIYNKKNFLWDQKLFVNLCDVSKHSCLGTLSYYNLLEVITISCFLFFLIYVSEILSWDFFFAF